MHLSDWRLCWPGQSRPESLSNSSGKIFSLGMACPGLSLGAHFANRSFDAWLKEYSIIHRLATAYHLQTNGQVEVFNRQITWTSSCQVKIAKGVALWFKIKHFFKVSWDLVELFLSLFLIFFFLWCYKDTWWYIFNVKG